VTTRDDLHQLVDELSEEEAQLWLEALRTGDPMLVGMALAPIDDEPSTDEEDIGADEARQEYLQGKSLSAEEAKRRLLS
jgi:hypothetical protein